MLVCTRLSVRPLEGARTLRCTLLSLSWNLFVPREYYIRRLCGRMFAVLLNKDTWGRLLAEICVDKLWFFHAQWRVLWIRVLSEFFFNLCTRFGKKDRQTAPFAALFHCSCYCSSPFLLISLATDVNGILSNSMFIFSSSWAVSRVCRLLRYLQSWCAPSPTWSVYSSLAWLDVGNCFVFFLLDSRVCRGFWGNLMSLCCQCRLPLSRLLVFPSPVVVLVPSR